MAKIYCKSSYLLRRDKAANWSAKNPILREGEEGYETDTGRRKIGDGTTEWNNLKYDSGIVDQTYNPNSENAQSGKAVKEAVTAEQQRADNTFANALKCSKSGSAILIDDVSPVTHEMGVKVRGKNLLNNILTSSQKGVDLTSYRDYWVLNGTCTESSNFEFQQANLQAGTYTLSTLKSNNIEDNSNPLFQLRLQDINDGSFIYFDLNNNNVLNKSITFTVDKEYILILRIRIQQNITYDNYYIYPQLELGTTATEYTPYVPYLTAVKVSRCGKNLFDINDNSRYISYKSHTDTDIVKDGQIKPTFSISNLIEGESYTISYHTEIPWGINSSQLLWCLGTLNAE